VVPALLLRRAATSPPSRRLRDYAALAAFNAFWLGALVVPHLWRDDIVYDFIICVMLAVFLVIWMAAWIDLPWPRAVPSPATPGPEAPSPATPP
jgi:hypothetical protein